MARVYEDVRVTAEQVTLRRRSVRCARCGMPTYDVGRHDAIFHPIEDGAPLRVLPGKKR